MSEKEMIEDFKGITNGNLANVLVEHVGPERFENIFFPVTGRVAFLDFENKGIDTTDTSRDAADERTSQWLTWEADLGNWFCAFVGYIDAMLDKLGIDEIDVDGDDAPTFCKGDKVLVKDNYHRVWAEATYVTEWNGFYYTSNDADDGRSLNRWEECKPYESEEDKALDEAIQCGKDEGWIRNETWN